MCEKDEKTKGTGQSRHGNKMEGELQVGSDTLRPCLKILYI